MKIISIILLSVLSVFLFLFAYVQHTEASKKQYQLDYCNSTLEISLDVSDSLIFLKNDTISSLREELENLRTIK